jgi:DNA-directed RNA polymerase specialized sigma24 family protein
MTDSKNTLIKSAVMATTAPAMLRTDDLDSNPLPVANEPFIIATLHAAAARSRRAGVTAGLTEAERDDLFQEIVLDILERREGFNPEKGAPGTFTGIVSAHRTADFMSNRKQDRWRFVLAAGTEIESLVSLAGALVGQFTAVDLDAANDELINDDDGYVGQRPLWQEPEDHARVCGAASDLQAALSAMSDEQRSLYELLALHQDLPAAAKVSGMSSATFYRRVADLEMHLRMFGFKTAA